MMQRRTFLGASALTFASAVLPARAATANARTFLDRELANAAAAGKGVLLVFHASWCPWCRLLDQTLADPAAMAFLDPRFRTTRIRVLERRAAMRTEELPGAEDLLHQFGGSSDRGLPTFLLLNGNGEVLASSLVGAGNIGFPVDPDELDALDEMVRLGAPLATTAEIASLRAAFMRHAPD